MSLSYFYIEHCDPSQKEIVLDEDTSYHIVQVLRMKPEEKLKLTDGKGNLLEGGILECHKKHCTVKIQEASHKAQSTRKITIAISLIKNTSRFEWFLEKATEIGVIEIIPLICERTVREKFRFDRMKGICISAMLQSQQCWLPVLHEPQTFEWALKNAAGYLSMIAHCGEGVKKTIPQLIETHPSDHYTILIGPEGDFTPKEIEYAGAMQYFDATLGETRLRTETAGVVAAALLKMI